MKDQPIRTDNPAVRRVERNAAGQLVAWLEGRDEPVEDVRVARCFPWSVPDSYISLRNADGHEVALLETLDELPDEARAVIEAELRDKVFNPQILEVLEFEHEFGVSSIRARTDRGEVNFQVRSRDDVRMLSATRALFRDADGNIYEVADLDALDPASRHKLAHYF